MKRTPKRNCNITPPRRPFRRINRIIKKTLLKKLIKMKTYESPLNHFRKTSKRHMLDEGLIWRQPVKKQKLSERRDSVIIINDENDFEQSWPKRLRSAKAKSPKNSSSQKKITNIVSRSNETANDSVVILEDDGNQPLPEISNPTEDVMVVWSSVPDSPEEKNSIQNPNTSESLPFVIDSTPSISNWKMLKGDYPRNWLGDWVSKEKLGKKIQPKNIISKSPKYQIGKRKKKTDKQNEQKQKKKINKEKEKEILIQTGSKEDIEEDTEHKKQKNTKQKKKKDIILGKLREIIIDGPNVARAHSNGKYFSEEGLQLVIDFFEKKGHTVKAFVPQHVRSRNRNILEDLNRKGFIVFTPSRKAGTKSITPYEDRFILEYATKCEGIVVSNDQFKDLYEEKPEWRETIEKRILPPTFVGDHLMFPEDPLGRHGPKLDIFLRHEI